jgi:hypothetical protein
MQAIATVLNRGNSVTYESSTHTLNTTDPRGFAFDVNSRQKNRLSHGRSAFGNLFASVSDGREQRARRAIGMLSRFDPTSDTESELEPAKKKVTHDFSRAITIYGVDKDGNPIKKNGKYV